LAYLRQVTGGEVPEEKLQAYVEQAPHMLDFLEATSRTRFEAAERYADYYPELEGGKHGGRSMDPGPISRRKLGAEAEYQRVYDMPVGFSRFSMTVREGREVMDMGWKAYFIMARSMLRYYLDIPSRLKGLPDNRMTLGRGLIASLRLSLLDKKIPLQLNHEVTRLLTEDGRVVGVEVNTSEGVKNIQARKGVLMAAGGFGQNPGLREFNHGLPEDAEWSNAAPGDVGDGIRMGQELGAELEFMHCAWWTPTVMLPGGAPMALISGKSMPGSIFVDDNGNRFTNEAAPYEDVTKAQLAWHNEHSPCIPCHMIFDRRFRNSYPAGPLPPSRIQPDSAIPAAFKEANFLIRSDSLEGLAKQCGIDSPGLVKTVRRHNTFAVDGKDLDYGRGDSSNDRYYSDLKVKPNPNLAPIEQPPFYAIKIFPGDLGTKGGLKCDKYARVQNKSGEVIAGLYVTGNCAGSVMGNSYPGAGATIGPSMTFGYVAALHACGK
jgi:3-oxosteroid 1-dehydrogenase